LIIPVDYAQANFRFTGSALPYGAEMTLGLNIELIPGSLSDLATSLATFFNTNIMPEIDSEVSFSSVYVKAGPNTTGASAEAAGGGAGAVAGTTSPPNCCALIRKVTPIGGRQGRGRMYMPGLSDGNVLDNGVIGSGVVTSLQGHWDDFFDDLVAYPCPPALLHAPGSPTAAPILLTGFQVDSRIATQRRRLRR